MNRSWRRRVTRWVLLLLLCSFLQIMSASAPASAATNCADATGGGFDGYLAGAAPPAGGGVTYEGMSAQMVVNLGTECEGVVSADSNFSFTWVMLKANTGHFGGKGYVQVGFFNGHNYGCAYSAYEYNKDLSDNSVHRFVQITNGCLPMNQYGHFWIQYNPTDNLVNMNYNNHVLNETPFSPISVWQPYTYGPFQTQWISEETYQASDVPTSRFNQMQTEDYNDHWSNTLPALAGACGRPAKYIRGAVSNQSFGIQTSGASLVQYC